MRCCCSSDRAQSAWAVDEVWAASFPLDVGDDDQSQPISNRDALDMCRLSEVYM